MSEKSRATRYSPSIAGFGVRRGWGRRRWCPGPCRCRLPLRLYSPCGSRGLYYDFHQNVGKVQGHQVLAINRGEREEFLKVSVATDRDAALVLLRRAVVRPGSKAMDFVKSAAEDAYDRLLYPSLEREIRSTLTDEASEGAIHNFALNLRLTIM